MTLAEIRSAIWKFLRRNWMLCTFIAMSLVCITDYDLTAKKLEVLLGLIGLFGAVYCLKKFGLDRCIWIYMLPIVLTYLNLTAIDAYRTSWLMVILMNSDMTGKILYSSHFAECSYHFHFHCFL